MGPPASPPLIIRLRWLCTQSRPRQSLRAWVDGSLPSGTAAAGHINFEALDNEDGCSSGEAQPVGSYKGDGRPAGATTRVLRHATASWAGLTLGTDACAEDGHADRAGCRPLLQPVVSQSPLASCIRLSLKHRRCAAFAAPAGPMCGAKAPACSCATPAGARGGAGLAESNMLCKPWTFLPGVSSLLDSSDHLILMRPLLHRCHRCRNLRESTWLFTRQHVPGQARRPPSCRAHPRPAEAHHWPKGAARRGCGCRS
jgi:hypothetical protein